jgi:hypothetical protein
MSYSKRFHPQHEGASPHPPGAVPAVTVPERLALSVRALGEAGQARLAALPGFLAVAGKLAAATANGQPGRVRHQPADN